MQAFLDQGDVVYLMAQASPHARAIIAGKLVLGIDRPKMLASEIDLAHDIIRKLNGDVEKVVRHNAMMLSVSLIARSNKS